MVASHGISPEVSGDIGCADTEVVAAMVIRGKNGSRVKGETF